jgi:hypothetical protein
METKGAKGLKRENDNIPIPGGVQTGHVNALGDG